MAEQTLPAALPDVPQAALDALRQAGAARVDPVRLRYLEALASRMAQASPAVAAGLQGRWQAACAALAQRCQAPAAPAPSPAAAPSPLAVLNQHVLARSRSASAQAPDALAHEDAAELRSLRAFRETWSRIAAVDRVDAAVTRGPENAGPLNSHALVLRSIALMRSLSPDYLRRYLAQVEALMLLEQLAEPPRPAARPKVRPRSAARAKGG